MFIPIAKPYLNRNEEIFVRKVIQSRWIAQGQRVREFEKKVCDYVGTKYGVCTSSGTTALHLALLVLGIGQGDEVIIPSFSFIATANSILYCGAEPIFVDIDPKTYNISPENIEQFIEKECEFDIRKKIVFDKITGARVKAIMPVHQFGLPCDMKRILKIARKFNLLVLEDAACALGAKYENKMIGSISSISCFSFHPRKILTTGEGGMILTNNKEYAKKARSLRDHGIDPSRKNYTSLGYNYRMTDMQAAVGLSQMDKLIAVLYRRNIIARYYDRAFKKNTPSIQIPYIPPYATPNYQSYVIWIKDASLSLDKIMRRLVKSGISVRRGNIAIHLEPFYKKRRKFKLPNTEKAVSSTIALPIFHGMRRDEQDHVIDTVISLIKR